MAKIVADRVAETTTTTGTSAIALAAAMTGFRRFNAVCAIGDIFDYTIQSVDGSGNPTGDWETGLGTYSAANTLTRTTIYASSNAGAAVNFAAGTKQVFLDLAAPSLNTGQVITDATTARTAAMGDLNNYIRFTSSSSITFTLPPNSSVPLPVGAVIEFEQAGTGALTIAAGAGVTVNSRGADLTLAGQYATGFAKKVATDTWTVGGDL